MYYNQQVVWDGVKKKPVHVGDKKQALLWAWSNIPEKSQPFVWVKTKKIFLPPTILIATVMMKAGEIRPAEPGEAL